MVRTHDGVIKEVSLRRAETGNGGTGSSDFPSHAIDRTIEAGIVISAAGVGIGIPCLGGIHLLNKPGTKALGTPSTRPRPPLENRDSITQSTAAKEQRNDKSLLSRVLVDVVHKSHILQRRDGTIVIGGGYPQQVGGAFGASQDDRLNLTMLMSLIWWIRPPNS